MPDICIPSKSGYTHFKMRIHAMSLSRSEDKFVKNIKTCIQHLKNVKVAPLKS